MLEIKSAKATATPGPFGWARVYSEESLFVLLSSTAPETGVETITSGRDFLSRLRSEYFGNLEQKPFEALKIASEKVISEFNDQISDIEFAACVFFENVVYSVAYNGGRISIYRDGSLATILDSAGENLITASGYPKTGDVILIATKNFFGEIDQNTIKTSLAGNDMNLSIETFIQLMHSKNNINNMGIVLLGFSDNSNTEAFQAGILPKEDSIANQSEDFKNSASIFFKGLLNKIPERRIYIRNEMEDEVVSSNKKLTFSVGIILLAILFISIIFGVRQKGINDTKNKYQGILQEAQSEVDQAISLASVSPDKSRELFVDSEQKLQTILALKVKDPKITDLQNKIATSQAAVLGEYVASPSLFLDLTLLSSGFKGDTLSFSNGNISILDKTGLRIVDVDISTKKSQVVAGPGVLDSAFGLASYVGRTFVLSSDGIYEVGNSKNKVIDKTWQGDALIQSFAGNLYVLDKSGNAIYRYPSAPGNTFGGQQNWLAKGTNVNFSDAEEWGIDGSAYVLFPNSKILKFSLGSPQNFKINGVVPQIGTIDAIYADADNQYLYLLDRAGKRIVVTDKKGNYKAQYIGDEIANAINLVASEANKKIILLTGDKLLSIDIK